MTFVRELPELWRFVRVILTASCSTADMVFFVSVLNDDFKGRATGGGHCQNLENTILKILVTWCVNII